MSYYQGDRGFFSRAVGRVLGIALKAVVPIGLAAGYFLRRDNLREPADISVVYQLVNLLGLQRAKRNIEK
jgi:hypothetical protein